MKSTQTPAYSQLIDDLIYRNRVRVPIVRWPIDELPRLIAALYDQYGASLYQQRVIEEIVTKDIELFDNPLPVTIALGSSSMQGSGQGSEQHNHIDNQIVEPKERDKELMMDGE